MSRRLTVVQILPALDSGGVERGTLEIGRALVAAGQRSVVVSRGGRLVPQLVEQGSEHVVLPVHRKSPLSLLQVRPLRALLASLGADILHARSRVPAWLGWFALRGMAAAQRPRFVTTVHGMYSVSRYSAIMTRGEAVIAVSDTTRQYVLDHYPGFDTARIRVIHRGVAAEDFPRGFAPSAGWLADWHAAFPQTRGRALVTLPGRITRLKGHEAFIRLIAALKAAGVPVHGLVVGGAEAGKAAYLASLQEQVGQAGLGADISFTGLRSDMREIFALSDVVLSLSSQPESFGRTALEALAIGTPVVGWRRGGVGEILARMYPQGAVPAEDFDALLAAVRAALAGPATIAPVPPEFQLGTMCAATLALYRSLAQPVAA